MCNITRLHKLCRVKGSTVSVFIKDQPVSSRRVHRECYITRDLDGGFILVNLSFLMILNICAARMNFPAHKGMFIVCRRIRHVDLVIHFRVFKIRPVTDNVSANGNVVFIQIIDSVLSGQNGIISYDIAVCYAFVQLLCDFGTDLFNGKLLNSIQFIIGIICPAKEDGSFRQIAHTGIIKDCAVHISILGVCLLHHDGCDLCVIAAEFDVQPGIFSCRNNRIHREPGRLKSETGKLSFRVDIECCRNILIVCLMNECERFTRIQILGLTQCDPDINKITGLRLPFFLGFFVDDGNIIPTHRPCIGRSRNHRPGLHQHLLFGHRQFTEEHITFHRKNSIRTGYNHVGCINP